MNFCRQHKLIVMYKWFRKRKPKLYAWKSPRDRKCYQTDYTIVKQWFWNNIRDVKTLPGAYIDSYHNQLVAKVQTILKAIKKAVKRKPKWNLEKYQE